MRQGTLSAPTQERPMPYPIAGIDVHKKMLAVGVADVHLDGEYQLTHRKGGTSPAELRPLADWRLDCAVEHVVRESTAPSWRPVGGTVEGDWKERPRSRGGASPMTGTI